MFRGFLCYVIIQEYLLLCHQPLFSSGAFLPRKYTDGDTPNCFLKHLLK